MTRKPHGSREGCPCLPSARQTADRLANLARIAWWNVRVRIFPLNVDRNMNWLPVCLARIATPIDIRPVLRPSPGALCFFLDSSFDTQQQHNATYDNRLSIITIYVKYGRSWVSRPANGPRTLFLLLPIVQPNVSVPRRPALEVSPAWV